MYEICLRNKGHRILLHHWKRQVLARPVLDIQTMDSPTNPFECVGKPLRSTKELNTNALQIAAEQPRQSGDSGSGPQSRGARERSKMR